MVNRNPFWIVFLTGAALAAGCSENGVEPELPTATTVIVTPPSATVPVFSTMQLSATVLDQSGNEVTGQTVAWSSDDLETAEVDAAGLAWFWYAGVVKVTATVGEVSGTADFTVVCPEPQEVTANLVGAVTWSSDGPRCTDYIVTGNRSIGGSLVIEPGTWVMFRSNSGLYTLPTGDYIDIAGIPAHPVRFFGESDVPGFWRGLGIRNNDARNRIEFLHIDGAGIGSLGINTATMTNTAIGVSGGTRVAISRTTISNSAGDGIAATEAATNLTGFANNRFESIAGAPLAVRTNGLRFLDEATVYMTDDAPHGEPYVRATRDGDGITSNQTWPNTGIPIRYMTNGREVIDAHLTVAAGATIEFAAAGGGLMVRPTGALTADGSSDRITFRGATATPGAWQGLFFDSNNINNRLINVAVSDAGAPAAGVGGQDANIRLIGSPSRLQLHQSAVSNGLGCGVYLHTNAILDEAGTVYFDNAGENHCHQ